MVEASCEPRIRAVQRRTPAGRWRRPAAGGLAAVAFLFMASVEPAWAQRRCTTTTDPATGATRESCFDPATGERTVTTTSAPETKIIDVPVPPPPSGAAPPPEGGPGLSAPPPGPSATTPPPGGRPGGTVTRPPRRDSTREADDARKGATSRAKERLGYEDVEPISRPKKGPDPAGLGEQIRKLGDLIKEKSLVLPAPPEGAKEPPPEGGKAPPPEGGGTGEKDEGGKVAGETDELPKCGPDITLVLKHLVADVESAFHNTPDKVWDRELGKEIDPKRLACRSIVPAGDFILAKIPIPTRVNPKVGDAWEVEELRTLRRLIATKFPHCPRGGPKDYCKQTVTIEGKCYYMGSVNYLIYGVMWRLCGSRTEMTAAGSLSLEAMVRAYKFTQEGATNTEESVAWAKAGYQGWPSKGVPTPPPDAPAQACSPCSSQYLDRLHWHWTGLQPRGTYTPETRPANLTRDEPAPEDD